MSINPLDTNKPFGFAGLNPNPTFSKTKDGPVYRISFEVTHELWQYFVDANTKGMIIGAKMFVSDDGGEQEEKPAKPEKGPYGDLAQSLYHTGFFMNPKVRELLGTDEMYQEWTRKQPCIITGDFDWDDGVGQCEYCHVRRSGDAGTGIKPEYSGVPMKHSMHLLQHQHGESEVYREFLALKRKIGIDDEVDPQAAKDWFEKKAANNLYRWAREQLCHHFETDSLTKIHPRALWAFAKERGIDKYLPKPYKEAKDETDS